MPVSHYCRIAPTFWTDPDVKRALDRDEKLLLLYYFTSPHTNMIGLYYAPFEYVAAETGLSVGKVRELTLNRLAGFTSYDEQTEEVLVHRAARHQIGDELKPGDNRVKAVRRILGDAHSTRLVRKFRTLFPRWPDEAFEGVLSLPFQEGATKGLPSPSEAPPKPSLNISIAEADAYTGTDTSSSSYPSSGAHAPEGISPPDDPDALASQAILVANRGMRDNPAIGTAVNPIAPGHASRQHVLEWLAAGVPWEAIETGVYQAARTYTPDPPRHRQITSMKYFTGPVHDEWDRLRSEETEAPNGGNHRGGTTTGGGAAEPGGDEAAEAYGHLA